MTKHATLPASAAYRWLVCPPSARLEETYPDSESEYAKEGTAAHKLAEAMLSRNVEAEKAVCAGEYYNEEMEEHITAYAAYIRERLEEAHNMSPDPMMLLEQRLDLTPWVPEGFGTGDVIILADKTLEVIDLKYGKGLPVDATGNPQLRLYGLGALETFGHLYDITTVTMAVVQPRLNSLSTETLSVEALLAWGESHIKPIALQAFAGEGEFKAGDHCRFCRAAADCRARAEANLTLARQAFKPIETLSPEEIAAILTKADELINWAGKVKEYALDQAENHNVKWPGWKLVEGRSNRKYADEAAIANTLMGAGYAPEAIHQIKLLGITEMEKLVGKKKLGTLVGDFIIKPPGKPALVPENDKRTELNTLDAAKAIFKEEE